MRYGWEGGSGRPRRRHALLCRLGRLVTRFLLEVLLELICLVARAQQLARLHVELDQPELELLHVDEAVAIRI